MKRYQFYFRISLFLILGIAPSLLAFPFLFLIKDHKYNYFIFGSLLLSIWLIFAFILPIFYMVSCRRKKYGKIIIPENLKPASIISKKYKFGLLFLLIVILLFFNHYFFGKALSVIFAIILIGINYCEILLTYKRNIYIDISDSSCCVVKPDVQTKN